MPCRNGVFVQNSKGVFVLQNPFLFEEWNSGWSFVPTILGIQQRSVRLATRAASRLKRNGSPTSVGKPCKASAF
jgi:hypothetical protein